MSECVSAGNNSEAGVLLLDPFRVASRVDSSGLGAVWAGRLRLVLPLCPAPMQGEAERGAARTHVVTIAKSPQTRRGGKGHAEQKRPTANG